MLEEGRPLRPSRTFMDLKALVRHRHRLLHCGMPLGHIRIRQEPCMRGAAGVPYRMLGDELDDALGNGTGVEGTPGSLYTRHSTLVPVLRLCRAHPLQGLREIRIAQHLAHLRRATVGVIDLAGAGVE